ncbi:MAG: hypothetical protein QF719_06340 [Chloroflexota bacterium]|jgi:hypothetical protein|nr:hypothetical protein [Chloroflexota bacterium]MDP6508334.1 hypothetical protein [Chloroflexota bacterium]MDP6757817.1 hypothetical protein [Chloroflexota bacterium]
MSNREPGLRLTLLWLGIWAIGLGVLAIFAPGKITNALGAADGKADDQSLFLVSIMGSFMLPWGAGLLLAARSDHARRLWTALALSQALLAAVVIIFYLGRGAIDTSTGVILLIVFVLGVAGIGVFGSDELRGRGARRAEIVFRDDRNAGSQKPYTVNVDDPGPSGDA